jgi:hypothetical protein
MMTDCKREVNTSRNVARVGNLVDVGGCGETVNWTVDGEDRCSVSNILADLGRMREESSLPPGLLSNP